MEQGALTTKEAWMLQDEMLLQMFELPSLTVPVEWRQMLVRLSLSEWTPDPDEKPQ